MKRLRGAGWAILLWTVLLAIYGVASLVTTDISCEGGPAGCEGIVAIVVLIAASILWLIGAVALIATDPHGAARGLLIRIIVNSLAFLLTLGVLSLIRLPATGADGVQRSVPLLDAGGELLVIGFLFALANAVVRPVLFALFGRLIVRTMGLAVVLVNAVLFWLVGELSGLADAPWTTPDPQLLWLFVDSIVFTFILAVIDAFLGLDRPQLDPHPDGRMWRFLERLPAQRRNALIESIRLQEVYDTVASYGLEIVVGGTALAPVRRLGDRVMGRTSADLDALSTPAKVRIMLQQLGPTYVKLGQIASSRADALPEEWRVELDKLQSTVPPFPWEQAEEIISAELGAEPETLFATIDHTPFGAASLAQVHRATLKDGREVVVKVQRPDVRAKVRADLGVIMELAKTAESRVALARQLDATGLVKEFSDGVLEELDYTIEAYHARRLADVIASIPGTGVPAIVGELSTDKVLTMDFVPGVKATHADELDPGVDREQVARTFMRAVLKQVMVDGFFHADPHPGNIVLDTSTGKVTFLDLGLVGEIAAEQRIDLLALLWALRMKQPRALATVSLRLCVVTEGFDEAAYRADVERLYHQYWVYGGSSFSGMVTALFATLRQHGLRMRKELTLAVKSITQAEELLRAIKPDMKLVDVATEEVEWLVRDELRSNRLASLAESQIAEVVSGLVATANERRAELGPLLVEALLGGRFDSHRPSDAIDLSGLYERFDALGSRLDRLGQRLTLVAGAVGIAIALSIVLGAVVLNPGVTFDGVVLIVGTLAAIGIGWLGWMTYRGRATP